MPRVHEPPPLLLRDVVVVGGGEGAEDVVGAGLPAQNPVQKEPPQVVVAWQVTAELQGELSPTVQDTIGVGEAGVHWPRHGMLLVQMLVAEHVKPMPQGPSTPVVHGTAVDELPVVAGAAQNPTQLLAPPPHVVVAWHVAPELQGTLSPTVQEVVGELVGAAVQRPRHGMELVQGTVAWQVLLDPQGISTPVVQDAAVDVVIEADTAGEQKPVQVVVA